MNNLRLFLILVGATVMLSCGEGVISLDNSTYQPKIVIEGTLIPGANAQIKLRRNFPLETSAPPSSVILQNAQAQITDSEGGIFPLQFNAGNNYYESKTIQIEHEKTYTLQVDAVIDGRQLSAKSTTLTPKAGLQILVDQSNLGRKVYRQLKPNGRLDNFSVTFERSPATDYYVISMTALDANQETFIYDNAFGDLDTSQVVEQFDQLRLTWNWLMGQSLSAGQSQIEIYSFMTWFYGRYRVILYGGDKNFRDFFSTYGQIQELDGNFHEPKFHIEGEGIGLFGSAVIDTAFFEILPHQSRSPPDKYCLKKLRSKTTSKRVLPQLPDW